MLLVFLCLSAAISVLICCLSGYAFPALIGFFLLWFAAALLGVFLVYLLLVWLLSLFVDRNKVETEEQPFYRFVLEESVRMFMQLCGISIHVSGLELLPKGVFLLAGNHRSGFDPFIAITALHGRRLTFISKPSNFRIPIGGAFMHKCGFLPIDRDNDKNALRTILAAADRMKRGVFSIGVYPEGTRSKTGELLPFRNGCFKAAQRAGVPIVIAATRGSEKIVRNLPFRKTDVYFTVCGVLDAETVKQASTAEVGTAVHDALERTLTDNAQ